MDSKNIDINKNNYNNNYNDVFNNQSASVINYKHEYNNKADNFYISKKEFIDTDKNQCLNKNEPLEQDQDIEPFNVCVRIRPILNSDLIDKNNNQFISNKDIFGNSDSKSNLITIKNKNILLVKEPYFGTSTIKSERLFSFDKVFSPGKKNIDIFNISIKPIINNVLKGYNSTTLAYGMTGSGKTHTIFGSIGDSDKCNIEKGLCFYAADYLITESKKIKNLIRSHVKVSYLEIYNETVIDLLSDGANSLSNKNLMIVEDSQKGIIVPELSEYTVNDANELSKYIQEGNKRRTMATTNQNAFSSRSHAILQISLEQMIKTDLLSNKEKMNCKAEVQIKSQIISSKFLVVDLAGSEKLNEKSSKRTQEGSNINKSLLSLGNCINLLSDCSKKGCFVPYRDSKLTRLLKDSLGGNIMTTMIACITPSSVYIDETLSTLNYAIRAKKIKKKISKNIKEVDGENTYNKEIINALKKEIDTLKCHISINNLNKTKNTFNENNSKLIIDKLNDLNFPGLLNKYSLCNFCKIKLRTFDNESCKNLNLNLNILKELSSNEKTIIMNTDNSLSALLPNDINLKIEFTNDFFIIREYENNNYLLNLDTNKKSNTNNKNNLDFNLDKIKIEDIDYQIENLNTSKLKIEDELLNNTDIYHVFSKSKSNDFNKKYMTFVKNYNKKLLHINNTFDKYIDIMNKKLIENLEQYSIINFNIKELDDLNYSNFKDIETLNNFKKSLELSNNNNKSNLIQLLENIKIEENIIYSNIKENNNVKNELIKSLNVNLNQNNKIKNILKKLILYTVRNDNTNNLNRSKNEFVTSNVKENLNSFSIISKNTQIDINKIKENNHKLNVLLKRYINQINSYKVNIDFKEKEIAKYKNSLYLLNNNNKNKKFIYKRMLNSFTCIESKNINKNLIYKQNNLLSFSSNNKILQNKKNYINKVRYIDNSKNKMSKSSIELNVNKTFIRNFNKRKLTISKEKKLDDKKLLELQNIIKNVNNSIIKNFNKIEYSCNKHSNKKSHSNSKINDIHSKFKLKSNLYNNEHNINFSNIKKCKTPTKLFFNKNKFNLKHEYYKNKNSKMPNKDIANNFKNSKDALKKDLLSRNKISLDLTNMCNLSNVEIVKHNSTFLDNDILNILNDNININNNNNICYKYKKSTCKIGNYEVSKSNYNYNSVLKK